MKMIRFSILSLGMLITAHSFAQQLPPPGTPSVAKKNPEKQPKKKNVVSPHNAASSFVCHRCKTGSFSGLLEQVYEDNGSEEEL